MSTGTTNRPAYPNADVMVSARFDGLERCHLATQKPFMPCYSVLLDAKLTHHFLLKGGEEQHRGYVVLRYVLARNPADAFHRAQKLERKLIERKWSAVQDSLISISFEHEEIEVVPIWLLLRRRYGRAFYKGE